RQRQYHSLPQRGSRPWRQRPSPASSGCAPGPSPTATSTSGVDGQHLCSRVCCRANGIARGISTVATRSMPTQPTTFLGAIASHDFASAADGDVLTNTGLTDGSTAVSFATAEGADVVADTGSKTSRHRQPPRRRAKRRKLDSENAAGD